MFAFVSIPARFFGRLLAFSFFLFSFFFSSRQASFFGDASFRSCLFSLLPLASFHFFSGETLRLWARSHSHLAGRLKHWNLLCTLLSQRELLDQFSVNREGYHGLLPFNTLD